MEEQEEMAAGVQISALVLPVEEVRGGFAEITV